MLRALIFAVLAGLAEAKFEPYQLNGGLVCAVAGRDYAIIASDTRLIQGYEICTRRHLSSRLWCASSPGGDADAEWDSSLIDADGGVRVPAAESSLPRWASSETTITAAPATEPSINHDGDTDGRPYITSVRPRPPILDQTKRVSGSPCLVGSAGCAADSEQLKRVVNAELVSHARWSACPSSDLGPSRAANLLQQVLYGRRGFPYYAFCVLAGLEEEDEGEGTGASFVYDAIGSYERVAVGSAGTGRELLQPILDRMFAVSNLRQTKKGADDNFNEKSSLWRDGGAVSAVEQRRGLGLRPPVRTCVDCPAEEAVTLLVRAFRSVSEREISVGDDLVVCIIRRLGGPDGDAEGAGTTDKGGKKPISGQTLEVLRFPLKKH